jgi:hypothetical protein
LNRFVFCLAPQQHSSNKCLKTLEGFILGVETTNEEIFITFLKSSSNPVLVWS